MSIKVLYEDNHLIVVVKLAGVLSQADKTGDPDMLTEVKKYLKEKYKKQGNVFVGLLHRLDRPVSGIMLFAKTSKGASRLSEQIRNGEVGKIYHALVIGKPKKATETLLSKVDGKDAYLSYELMKSNKKYSLLKIILGTGRKHQIRKQLSEIELSILGDVKYGGEKWENEKSIALCATRLSFKLATEDKVVDLSIEVPKEWEKYTI